MIRRPCSRPIAWRSAIATCRRPRGSPPARSPPGTPRSAPLLGASHRNPPPVHMRLRSRLTSRSITLVGLIALGALTGCAGAVRDPAVTSTFVPTGQRITPLAAPGADFAMLDPGLPFLPDFRAGQAVALAPSPDGRLLLALTSGFNRNFDSAGRRIAEASNEYVFVYDVGAGVPRKQQVLTVPNSFIGIAWDRDGGGFHVSGGVDDVVHSYRSQDGVFAEVAAPIPLGHQDGLGVRTKPVAAGLARSPAGQGRPVVNHENDSGGPI